MNPKKTFKDKVLDVVYYAGLCEEGKWRDGEGVRHLHRMEMCIELADKIEELSELVDGLKEIDERYRDRS